MTDHLGLTAEQDALLGLVREVAAREIAPHAAQWEHDSVFPRGAFTALGKAGLLGLVYVAMLGGIISVVGDNLNFGSQVLLNDIYRRHIVKHASERHYLIAGRASFSDGGWQNSPMADLIPTILPLARNGLHRDFSPVMLTPQGAQSVLCRLDERHGETFFESITLTGRSRRSGAGPRG